MAVLIGNQHDPERDTCGAVDPDDWDACGACSDCNPEAECFCNDIDSCDVAEAETEAAAARAYIRAGYTKAEADPG